MLSGLSSSSVQWLKVSSDHNGDIFLFLRSLEILLDNSIPDETKRRNFPV